MVEYARMEIESSSDLYLKLRLRAAEIERQIRHLVDDFPHTRIVLEIGDSGRIVKVEFAPRFVEKDFK